MGEAHIDFDVDRVLSQAVSDAWDQCLLIWRKRGRVEDLPRNVCVPRYRVTPEKWLGRAFAERFLDQFSFVIHKLTSSDRIEAACAHDVLNYMIPRWEIVPEAVWTIASPLPDWIRQELADCPNRYETFQGQTIGDLFRFEYEDDS
jgi:hypothetical protein